jgi:simple sugar transport system permease protein
MSASSDTVIVLSGVVAQSAPLLFAATGEYAAERTGTLNISIEAMMLSGSYCAVVFGSLANNAVVGLLAGVAAGFVVSFIHANFSHRLSANTFVVGLTLDAIALAVTDFFATLSSPPFIKITSFQVPILSHIPIVGTAIFNEPWPLYLLIVIIPGVWWVVGHTRIGLEGRAAGEDPVAADANGISVNKRRRQGLYLAGGLSGLGGAYLSLCIVGTFNYDMTAGIGFVVIAAVIFGGWTLSGALVGALLFGAASAMGLVLPTIGYQVNPQLLLALPYVAALVAMIFLAKSQNAPRALAQPFSRESLV